MGAVISLNGRTIHVHGNEVQERDRIEWKPGDPMILDGANYTDVSVNIDWVKFYYAHMGRVLYCHRQPWGNTIIPISFSSGSLYPT
jgi:hypothetical protein